MRRGEVYFVDFGKDKTTHKQCGIRPAVIVSNNRGNGHGPTVTVVPLTGNIHKRPEMPTHVQIPLSLGMGKGFILSPYPLHKKGAWCYAKKTKETV